MSWFKKIGAYIAGAVAIVLAIFAIKQGRRVAAARDKANDSATFIEQNSARVKKASKKADVARAKAKVHQAEIDVIRAKHVKQLEKVADETNSLTARDLADQLGRL